MLPVTERRPARGTDGQDAAAMSYERALRIHARHRKPAPAAVAPKAVAEERAAPSAREATGGKTATHARVAPAKISPPGSPIGTKAAEGLKTPKASAPARARPISAARPEPAAARCGETSVRTAAFPAGKRKAPGAGSSQGAKASGARPDANGKAQTTVNSRRKTSAEAQSASHARSAEAAAKSLPSRNGGGGDLRQTLGADGETREATLDLASHKLPRSQLELLPVVSPIDQRRTIVSVRLTEDEFACLRERAEESGISVSAYMRSCVVDAEQLRAQVKRALAEMRQLSAATGPEIATAITTSSRRSGDVRHAYGWIKLAMRPFTFLFGPLFPSRAAPGTTVGGRSGR